MFNTMFCNVPEKGKCRERIWGGYPTCSRREEDASIEFCCFLNPFVNPLKARDTPSLQLPFRSESCYLVNSNQHNNE